MQPPALKQTWYAGIGIYLILLCYAILFHRERMAVPDDAYYTFEIARTGTFTIQHSRFIACMTEFFPWLAMKLSLSLHVMILWYSAGFVLYYFICYLLCGLVFRNYKAGIALLLYLILFTTHTFYWMLSEISQGIALLFVVFSALSDRERTRRLHAGNALLLVLTVFIIGTAHPLLVFPTGFMLLYLWVAHKAHRKFTIVIAAAYLLTLMIKNKFLDNGYDAGAMGGLKNFKEQFPHYLTLYSTKHFVKNWAGKYCWIPLLVVVNAVFYIQRRSWFRLLLMLAYTGGFALLICVCYPGSDVTEFYLENLYLPLGIGLTIPFAFDVLPALQLRKLALPAFAFVALACLYRIYGAHRFYTDRLTWQRSMIQQYNGQKVILDHNFYSKELLMFPWCTPYEFWLLSVADGKPAASILISEDPGSFRWATEKNKTLVVTYGNFDYKDLPQRYFPYTDTLRAYQIIKKAP